MNLTSAFIRNAVFPLMEIRKGNKIRSILRDLKISQNWSLDQLDDDRKGKLRKLLTHSIQHVPAYKSFQELQSIIDEDPVVALQQLPILTKPHFIEHQDDYFADHIDRNTLIPNQTGGSTGIPAKFYLDRITVEHYEAARWRGLSWHGINIGDPSVMIWGSPIELSQTQMRKFTLKERFLKNRFIIPAFQLNGDTIEDYVAQINRFKPTYIYGYASALFLFATLMRESGMKITHPLAGVVSTAEALYDDQRAVIEAAFGCPAINEYGARDGGMIAYECSAGQMHLQAENMWVEIVDISTMKPVPVGNVGRILITDLNNFVMPRLRYQLGDVCALSAETCSCGLNLPLIEQIEGRIDDIFVTKDGSYVHGQFFGYLFRNMNSIKQYQAIQHSVDHITLKVVVQDGSTLDQDETTKLLNMIKEHLGSETIDLQVVNEIPLAASGKFRNTLREFPLPTRVSTT